MASLAMRVVAPVRSARTRAASRSSRADAAPKRFGTAVANRRAPLLDRRDRPGARRAARAAVVPKAASDSDDASTEAAAKAVAAAFVDAQVTSGMRVGVTSGAVVSCVLAEIHARVVDGRLRDVVAVPADALAAKEAAVAGVTVSPFLKNDDGKLRPSSLDVLAMQPDELVVNCDGTIDAVFGRPQRPVQPDLITARAMVAEAKKVALLVTHSDGNVIRDFNHLFEPTVTDGKKDENDRPNSLFLPLGGKVPVAMRYEDKETFEELAEELDDVFLGDAEVWRRGAELDANPRGGKNPYVSPDGKYTIIDLVFNDPLEKPPKRWRDGFVLFGKKASASKIAAELLSVDGVAAHGLVLGADVAYVGETRADGTVAAREIS
jgi:ribose 5-phosphate isomerase A